MKRRLEQDQDTQTRVNWVLRSTPSEEFNTKMIEVENGIRAFVIGADDELMQYWGFC